MHSDHYRGLSNSWSKGPIYCTNITKKLILCDFPDIKEIHGFEFNQEFEIETEKNGRVGVVFIDSNHILGSALVIFKTQTLNVIHTGDMRYI